MNNVEKTVIAITVIIFVLVGAALVRSSIISDNFEKNYRERGGVYFKTKNDRICLKQESVIDVKIETNRF